MYLIMHMLLWHISFRAGGSTEYPLRSEGSDSGADRGGETATGRGGNHTAH